MYEVVATTDKNRTQTSELRCRIKEKPYKMAIYWFLTKQGSLKWLSLYCWLLELESENLHLAIILLKWWYACIFGNLGCNIKLVTRIYSDDAQYISTI